MTRGLVDAILVAIRDASVAEIGHSSDVGSAGSARPGPGARARVTAPAARLTRATPDEGQKRGPVAARKPTGPAHPPAARRKVRATAAQGRADPRAWDDGHDAGGGTAITDPESVLAAFGGDGGGARPPAAPAEERAASTPRSTTAAPSSAASPASAPEPERAALPALRENETALRTAGGGTVIRRKRSPVRAA